MASWPSERTRQGAIRRRVCLRRLAAGEVVRAAWGGDDAAILALGRYLRSAMQAAPAPVCVTLGLEGDLILAQAVSERTAPATSEGVDDPRSARACAETIGAYDAALSLSDVEAAGALRRLVARAIHPVREASALP